MPTKWQTWFPFHVDAFRGSPAVQAMHPAARAGYIYLLGAAWQTEDCTIPNDPLQLGELSGLGDELWQIHSPRIIRKFEPVGERLRNARLYVAWLGAKRMFEARQGAATRTNAQRGRIADTGGPDGDRAVTDTGSEQSANRSADTETGTGTGTLTETREGGARKRAPARPPTRARRPEFTLARAVLVRHSIPTSTGLPKCAAEAIQLLMDEKMIKLEEAAEILSSRIEGARGRCEKVNRLWFEDRCYRPETESLGATRCYDNSWSLSI